MIITQGAEVSRGSLSSQRLSIYWRVESTSALNAVPHTRNWSAQSATRRSISGSSRTYVTRSTMGSRPGEYSIVYCSIYMQLTRQVCSGKAFGMKDYRKTHQERENKPSVQCRSWSVVFISRGVAALLTAVRYNSPASIKHARNLPRHMQQVHGHCKDHSLGVSTISLTLHTQRLPLPHQRNVRGSSGRRRFTGH